MIGFFRELFGIRKVGTLAELREYIGAGRVCALANWIDWRIKYAKDKGPEDEWLPAGVTIARGEGDCEDKAIVAWEVIRTWPGWSAWLMRLERDNPDKKSGMDAHAVCVFETPDGQRGVMDGRAHVYPNKTAWGSIFKDIGNWQRSFFVTEKGQKI